MDRISPEQLDILDQWIFLRENIRLRRAAGNRPPWTSDEILANYRFCNVRRMDDKVSVWLQNWHDENKGDDNVSRIAFACVAGRLINWPASLAELPYPVPYREAEWTNQLLNRKARKEKIFTGAYIINGALGGDKIFQVTQKILTPLWRDHRSIPASGITMREVWASLNGRPGIGSFMAGQAVADLRHVLPQYLWRDRHTWAPRGPGSARGVNRLLERPVSTALPYLEWLDVVRQAYAQARARRPNIFKRLELMDFQNCLCEYDKYCRLRLGQGSVRSRYNPGGKQS